MANTEFWYQRKATVALDGQDGFLYVYQWDGGFLELVFPTQKAADKWIETRFIVVDRSKVLPEWATAP